MFGILKKQRIWKPTIALVCLLFCGATLAMADGFNWRKYEGTTLRAILGKSAFTPITMKQVKEFEEMTGIKVQAEYYPSEPGRRKVIMELGARNKDLDVFQGLMKTAFQYNAAGWLEPLDKYISNPALTSPDYDFEDFFKTTLPVIDGKLIGISGSCNPQVLIYRKDLFEKYGIAVPTNWQELEAAAKTLKANLDKGTFAWIARMNAENTAPFGAFLHTNHASWLDADGKPAFNSPKGVEALEFYGRMAREYGPPGASNIGWKEVIGAMAQDKAAMTVEISIFANLILENPKQSKVVGKLGYALVPPGVPGNFRTMLPLNTTHISAFSEKKEAAWYFVQYMSSKEATLTVKLLGLPTTRKSSWEDPAWKAKDRLPGLTKIQLDG
ncbi:MAG: sugar ABC transporter substrate-binding protein, partial [bacterium]